MTGNFDRSIDARYVAATGAAPGCATGRLPVRFDRLLAGTPYNADFGQSPAAFAAGRNFEKACAGPNDSYAPLFQALDEAGIAVGVGGVDAPTGQDDAARARRTRQRLKKMLDGDQSVVIYAQAVLDFEFAGLTAMIRPDAVVIVPARGRLHVVELKGFRLRDGHYPSDKIAAALEQTAVYQLALRRTVAELGLDPALVAGEAVVVCAARLGLQPVATVHDNSDRLATLEIRIARTEVALAAAPAPDRILTGISIDDDPDDRLAAFEALVAEYGTDYGPRCLSVCAAAHYCREAAHDVPARLGGTRLLAGTGSLTTAVALSHGDAVGDESQAPYAEALAATRTLLDSAREEAGVPAPTRRQAWRAS